ncbi:MAG: substrate-binding domain-containing protein [Candidatus Saccharibacteria bacterium]|nr:substrate-binding domain-containing protein [Candidatus Saccharibacteria bacterium]
MDKKKLTKQIAIIILIILGFVLFNDGFYNLVTKNYINNYGEGMKEKSIDIESYLPFKDDSLIVHEDSDVKIVDNIPQIDGATALYPIYSAFVEALYPEESVKYDGKDFLEDSKIQKTGTTTAYQRVVDGEADIIFCGEPSKKQLEYAKSKNVELELVPIGKEAFVFIVNKNNKVDDLSIKQIKDIYTGEITNWDQVGGENKPIIALQRAEGSGSQTAMLSFMNGVELKQSPQSIIGRKIGYSFRYYVENVVKDGNIKMLSLNGVEPSIENIRNDKYPIVGNFYMVYRKDNSNENIEKIRDFVLSEKGQKIIEDTGYVSVNEF